MALAPYSIPKQPQASELYSCKHENVSVYRPAHLSIMITSDTHTEGRENMSRSITVKIKSVYGEEKVYPVCADAQTFADLAGTRTLTIGTIEQIKRLGYKVELVTQSNLASILGA